MKRQYDQKPIPTIYQGIQFKSRLEARWAIFFDLIGTNWHYEYEGYQLANGWYLPDFWIPAIQAWIEIKPDEPTEREKRLCQQLAEHTEKPCYLFYGMPQVQNYREHNESAYAFVPRDGAIFEDNYFAWCICPKCRKLGIQFEGRGARICGNDCCPGNDKGYTGDDRLFEYAYAVAANYQFTLRQENEMPKTIHNPNVDRRYLNRRGGTK